MSKSIPIAAAMFVASLSPAVANAQYSEPPPPPPSGPVMKLDRFEVGVQMGWLFGSDIDTVDGEVGLNGNLAYTGYFDFRLPKGFTLFELTYTYLPTKLEFEPFAGPRGELTDIDVHYFQIGAQQELPLGRLRPFVGLTLGASYFDPERYDSETYFSTILGAGLKVQVAENIGIRAQARLPYTWVGTDSAVFCGFGGCSYGFVGDGILQLDLAAGVYASF